MKIELDNEKEIYCLSDGEDESPDYISGELVDFGELAWLEKDGEMYFAFVATDGETDGRIYRQSDGIQAEIEPCDFDEDDADDVEPAPGERT